MKKSKNESLFEKKKFFFFFSIFPPLDIRKMIRHYLQNQNQNQKKVNVLCTFFVKQIQKKS